MADFDLTFPHPQDGVQSEARWQDKAGITHRAVGVDVHRDIRLMWTLCGQKDVPANAAWFGSDEVTCPACLEEIAKLKDAGWTDWGGGFDSPVHKDRFVRVRFRDGTEDCYAAGLWAWSHIDSPCDIIAYKIA